MELVSESYHHTSLRFSILEVLVYSPTGPCIPNMTPLCSVPATREAHLCLSREYELSQDHLECPSSKIFLNNFMGEAFLASWDRSQAGGWE